MNTTVQPKITKKRVLDFLKENKYLVGLGDYGIFLMEPICDETNECAVYSDPLNKTLKIVPSIELWNTASINKMKSVLMHELIHARVNIFNQEKEKLTEELIDRLEEQLVNDLERGYMKQMGIDTQEESIKYGGKMDCESCSSEKSKGAR